MFRSGLEFNKEKQAAKIASQRQARFLEHVHASCCARDIQAGFWFCLPEILENLSASTQYTEVKAILFVVEHTLKPAEQKPAAKSIAEEAYERAIAGGKLSSDIDSPLFAGNFMFMGYNAEQQPLFKNINTREYLALEAQKAA